jgi:hypothetical protein
MNTGIAFDESPSSLPDVNGNRTVVAYMLLLVDMNGVVSCSAGKDCTVVVDLPLLVDRDLDETVVS